MHKINRVKMTVDLALTALLPLLMAYSLIGEAAHEWLGLAMLLLFAAHHILNHRWYRNLFRGRYFAGRTLNTGINLLLCVCFALLAVSGIVLSGHVFRFLSISGGASLARAAHLLASYWGFVLMSLHLGLHWKRVAGYAGHRFPAGKPARRPIRLMRIALGLICAYGVFSFRKRGIGSYLLYRSSFVFFNFDEPVFFFLPDYLAVMVLLAAAGYALGRMLQGRRLPKKQPG